MLEFSWIQELQKQIECNHFLIAKFGSILKELYTAQ